MAEWTEKESVLFRRVGKIAEAVSQIARVAPDYEDGRDGAIENVLMGIHAIEKILHQINDDSTARCGESD